MKTILCTLIVAIAFLLLPQTGRSAELVTNGGFETGNFSGWTATNAASAWRLWTVSASGFGGNDGGVFVPVPNATSVQQGSFNAWNGVTAGTNQSFTLTQNVTLPAGFLIRMTWMDRYQMNHTQFCTTNCGTAQYFVEILNTSNVLLQTLYTVTTPTNTNSNTGWVNHVVDLSAFAGQTIRLRFRTLVSLDLRGPGQVEIDAVSVQNTVLSSANVTVGGRVLTSDGRAIQGATVSMSDGSGTTLTAITSPFGYYAFENVATGSTYIVTVSNKRYNFPNSPHVRTVIDEIVDMDFQAGP